MLICGQNIHCFQHMEVHTWLLNMQDDWKEPQYTRQKGKNHYVLYPLDWIWYQKIHKAPLQSTVCGVGSSLMWIHILMAIGAAWYTAWTCGSAYWRHYAHQWEWIPVPPRSIVVTTKGELFGIISIYPPQIPHRVFPPQNNGLTLHLPTLALPLIRGGGPHPLLPMAWHWDVWP